MNTYKDMPELIKEAIREVLIEEMFPLMRKGGSVTVRQAARMLGMSISGINKMIGDGRLEVKEDTPGVKRITLESIQNL